MVDAPAAPSRSISSALIASCSGAGRWRYNVATDTPIVGAISRADMPDARSFRAASIRLGVMTFLRSEEHTSELQSLMRISYAVFCLKKKTTDNTNKTQTSLNTHLPNQTHSNYIRHLLPDNPTT